MKPHPNDIAKIPTILIAHRVGTPALSIDLSLEGRNRPILLTGTTTPVVEEGQFHVSILSPESTKEKDVLLESAGWYFILAVQDILTKRAQSFCTVLRPEWNLPAIKWRLAA